jgi:hypothetical protein
MRLPVMGQIMLAFLAGCIFIYVVKCQNEGFQGSSGVDMSRYMLKTECPPVPDLSQYVLKSSIPPPQPIIIDTSADAASKCGECPPCPRPRCPDVKCPPPAVCPAAAPCPRPVCPETVVKCKAQEVDNAPVRPFMAPLGFGFGTS